MYSMCIWEGDEPLLRIVQQLGLPQLGVHDVFLTSESTQLGLRRLQLEGYLVNRMRRLPSNRS